jgi:type VI secretion system protein ImpC
MGEIDVEALLRDLSPLAPSGDDLEYDPAFLELDRAMRVPTRPPYDDPAPAREEPDWPAIADQALALLARTRDLRVAVHLLRALIRTRGFGGASDGLALVRGFLERHWETLHPRPDPDAPQDATFRINVLLALGDRQTVVRDVCEIVVVRSSAHGTLSLQDVDERPEIQAAFDHAELDELKAVSESVGRSIDHLAGIDAVMKRRVGAPAAPSFAALEDVLQRVRRLLVEQISRREQAAALDPSTEGGEAAPAPASPRQRVDENVQFTVFRPRSIRPERWYPLLAFAHLSERRPESPPDAPDPVAEVRRQAMTILEERTEGYGELVQDSGRAIPREGELTFVPEIPHVRFNPPSRSFLWEEPVHREEFRMRAAADLDGRTARGRLSVFLGSILVADVALSVRVEGHARPERAEGGVEAGHAAPFRRIFASYSREDTSIVRQWERYAASLGDDFVRDLTHLRAGEVWSGRLGEMIEAADIFQLFWSWRSLDSPFVKTEWERALALGRPGFVRPVYWETPFPERPDRNLPPPALRRLHFQRIAFEESGSGAAPVRPGHGSMQKLIGRNRPPRVRIEYEPETQGAQLRRELPFVMGVLTDLSGGSAERPLAKRSFVEIDRDNLDDVRRRLAPPERSVSPDQESAWRGLRYLVDSTETSEALRIRALDVSKDELRRALKPYRGVAWRGSPVCSKVCDEPRASAEPFGCLVGDYYFDHGPADVELLEEMSRIAAAAHAPFIGGAAPATLGLGHWSEIGTPRELACITEGADHAAWRALRESPAARYLVLTLPRALVREPEGSTWINSAFALAVNINRAFAIHGWIARIDGVQDGAVDGLAEVTPVEVEITDRRGLELEEIGLTPLVGSGREGRAAFPSVHALQRPSSERDPDARVAARLSTKLSYLFPACRFAHYVDQVASASRNALQGVGALEQSLQSWLRRYVDRKPERSTDQAEARQPLAHAAVAVDEIEEDEGCLRVKLDVRPRFQLRESSVSQQVILYLPKA